MKLSLVKYACLCGMALGLGVAVACAIAPSPLNPVQQRAMDAHACYLKALEPVLGPLSEDVLRSVLAGGNAAAILAAHRLSTGDILATATRWRVCDEAQVPDVTLENL